MTLVGRIVVSLSGHDKGRLALVIAEEERCVLLADGKHRRLSKPKRKNKKHIRMIPQTPMDPIGMTDGVLRRYLRDLADSEQPYHE